MYKVLCIEETDQNIINTSDFIVDKNGSVTANSITFNGTISAKVGNNTYTGMANEEICTITNKDNSKTTWRVVRGLIVGRTYRA